MKGLLSVFMFMFGALIFSVKIFALGVGLDSLHVRLTSAPVQEKVYIHMDNNCYFKGDTLWYKAYVVRADNHRYTDMSRILYVELVSPDGLVVERQQLIVSDKGYGCGDFVLEDSLYSGFYELRAYTKWMLNFCVTTHPYDRKDREQFYNSKMAADFFRQYGTIYSRVFPVYEAPEKPGDYGARYLLGRPKRRLDKDPKPAVRVTFYPEGGNLLAGTRQRVAFEAVNEEGEGIDSLQLIIGDGGQTALTEYMGRGVFELDVPEEGGSIKVRCQHLGKWYSFSLPKIHSKGVAVCLTEKEDGMMEASVTARSLSPKKEYGCAVLCRGQLKLFKRLDFSEEYGKVSVLLPELPTGVNDFVVFDEDGKMLTSRLFFINNGDYGHESIEVQGLKDEYSPYEQVSLGFKVPTETPHFSVSVRDAGSDNDSYDTGSMLTELLLSSELKGFVAWPDYYFESRDETHRRRLDNLLMVQGWRRYDFEEMTTTDSLRYHPEKTMTVEGTVYKTVTFEDITADEVKYWKTGVFGYSDTTLEMMDPNAPEYADLTKAMSLNTISADRIANADRMRPDEDKILEKETEIPDLDYQEHDKETKEETKKEKHGTPVDMDMTPHFKELRSINDPEYGLDHRRLSGEVTICAELAIGKMTAEVKTQTINKGDFSFQIPPYYGDAILFLHAKKNKQSKKRHEQKGHLDENAWPNYYVKRNLFFPIFAEKYSFYQNHLPSEGFLNKNVRDKKEKTLSDATQERELQGIVVHSKMRRTLNTIDYRKPAYVYDAYELYNLVTDYGLSFGALNFRRFPSQIVTLLLGNYGTDRILKVDGRMEQQIFYRNYHLFRAQMKKLSLNQSDEHLFKNLQLSRIQEIRLYTDFELRNDNKTTEPNNQMADVTVDFVTFPDDAKQYTFRDRRIVLHGFTFPRDIYQPDYSHKPLPEVKDYRRTLYWNPNAKPDKDGRFHADFYNGSRPVRLKVSAEGLTKEGKPVKN